jgi:Ca2+-transporting ATPase
VAFAKKPWTRAAEDVAEAAGVSTKTGLSSAEVKKRRRRYGSNRLRARKRKSAWGILVDQIKNLIILLLAVATALSFLFGQWLEGIAIVVAIVLNVAIGFFTELRATRSMEALHSITRVTAKVRRNDNMEEIEASQLVPGDLVLVEAGDIVTADLRLVEASKLRADESALTGESAPVGKETEPLQEETPLAERKNMLYKGTAVTAGSGQGIVVATGLHTELGRISELAQEAEEETSPLEKRLARLGYRLIWITLAVAVLVVGAGVLAGQELFLIMETAIALAVAAIPEGLPIVATIALARGMWRMADHNALMNRLSAVETLGATNVICADKTGTLTENRMTLQRVSMRADGSKTIEIHDEETNESLPLDEGGRESTEDGSFREILEVGVLCNNASLPKDTPDKAQRVGDPLEVALLTAGAKAGLHRDELLEAWPEVREEAFDPQKMMMATYHENKEGFRVAVKGSPETVLHASSRIRKNGGHEEMTENMRQEWLELNEKMAEQGLRMLAVATKSVEQKEAYPYEDLTFLGLLGLLDPPREDVADAIAACKDAGIRVIMVTGDQPMTAKNIAISTGLVQEEDVGLRHSKDLKSPDALSDEDRKRLRKVNIFVRVTPEQKLDIIALHQKDGDVVAMTGDGVNDAPALKKADIGIAMGQRGTQVAREAADIILKDDAFPTILVAIQQGRAIFDNIRKFILFLLSGNVAEIMIVAFALLVGAPLPILPLQILYLNMIGDVFPALALGVGKGDPSKMARPPRDPEESILTRGHWWAIAGYGLIITGAVLGAFFLALEYLGMETKQAVTVSFLSLAFARLWHVFNMRDRDTRLFYNDVTRNPFVWGALALCSGLLLAAVYTPGLSLALHMVHPEKTGWLLIASMSLVPLVMGQAWKALGR